jgi:Domain of unknown function (DUF4326)
MNPRRVAVQGDLFHGQVPAGAVYVGRAAPGLRRSRWANPHPVRGTCRACGSEHDQAGAVHAYAADLAARPDLAAAAVDELGGRDLACWCRTGPCHADVLLAVAAGLQPALPAQAGANAESAKPAAEPAAAAVTAHRGRTLDLSAGLGEPAGAWQVAETEPGSGSWAVLRDGARVGVVRRESTTRGRRGWLARLDTGVPLPARGDLAAAGSTLWRTRNLAAAAIARQVATRPTRRRRRG